MHRDCPIVGGGQAGYAAAQAANRAAEQGAYWEYHEALFSGLDSLDNDGFAQYAEQLGLDAAALLQCVDSGPYHDEVRDDWVEGRRMGVSATPTFFINGTMVLGAQALSVLMNIIDQASGR